MTFQEIETIVKQVDGRKTSTVKIGDVTYSLPHLKEIVKVMKQTKCRCAVKYVYEDYRSKLVFTWIAGELTLYGV
jgi:hypothetical protein